MRKFAMHLAHLFSSYLPDALSFCLILTLLVFAAALGSTNSTVFELIGFWGDSVWNLHTFAMQMCLILLLGHLLAQASWTKKVLNFLTSFIKSEDAALVWLVTLSSLCCWLNWGFGLIVSATLAKSIKQKFPHLHFGFLVATGYAGFLVWHGGLSGSIPLSIAGDDKILSALHLTSIPLTQTVFHPRNLMLVVSLVISLSLIALLLKTTDAKITPVEVKDESPKSELSHTFSEKLLVSPWVLKVFSVFGFIYLILYFLKGGSIHLNSINLILLMLVMLAYGSIKAFMREVELSVRIIAPILIQYPLYAGIMGMIQNSGLAEMLSTFFVGLSTAETFPLFTFLSAGLVNFFVPSGGGQWIIQGPVMLKAALELNVPIEKVVMAISWGDAWTNMIQPFWVLPILTTARMELKDMMSFCVIYLVGSGLVIAGFMYF